MDQNLPEQKLIFDRVVYTVERVKYWLSQSELDSFIFEFYFPETEDPNRPFLLCCYAFSSQAGYYNAYDPDVLGPYPGDIQAYGGPIKMAGNNVSAEDMSSLLEGNPDATFLVFTPSLTDYQQVMYTIKPYKLTGAGPVLGSGSINTNPSPPATSTVNAETAR